MTQASSAAPTPTEIVERPAPGLARGRWEGPPWMFVTVLVATALGALVWVALALRARRGAR